MRRVGMEMAVEEEVVVRAALEAEEEVGVVEGAVGEGSLSTSWVRRSSVRRSL